ncbi:MAG: hypothetical protein JW768_15465 [Chitinispirillaceae bacterium]|nr:hypothetical protein [Chitinispirillaceae bacterium]
MQTAGAIHFLEKVAAFSRTMLGYGICAAVLSGFCIAWYYIPLPERAPVAVQHLRETVFAGNLLLSFHFLAMMGILLFSFLSFTAAFFPVASIKNKAHAMLMLAMIMAFASVGALTGFFLSGHGSFARPLQALLATTNDAQTGMPLLVDTCSLWFFRVFLVHALVIPVAFGCTLLALHRQVKSSGHTPQRSVVRQSARFAGFVTMLIVLAYFLRHLEIPFQP